MRAAILAVTAMALLALWLDRPKPVKSVQVNYCVGEYLAAAKHPVWGTWEETWVKGWMRCDLVDRFENI